MRRAVVAVVAAGLVAAVVAVLLLGTEEGTRSAGSNNVDAGAFTVLIPRGGIHCQSNEFVPADADRIRMTIGSYDRPTPALTLLVKDVNGREVLRTRVPGGYPQGVTTLPLGRTTSEPTPDATFCVRPEGIKLALGGFADRARVDYLRPGRESYLGMAGTFLDRFDVGKPGWQGAWLLVLALGLIAAAWVVAVRVLLREASG